MDTGDIIFVKGNSWISRLVRLFDKGKFSHVAIAVSDRRIMESQYNTRVRVTQLEFESYEVVKMNLSEEQKRALINSIGKYRGKPYDFLLAFSIVSRWLRIDIPNYLICTELVMDVLKDIGVMDSAIKDMAPNEFYRYLKEKHPTE